jgi:DNA mismatch endonuclease Vsr
VETALKQHLPEGRFSDVSVARSRHMSSVKGKNNKSTERRLRAALVQAGIRGWRLHPSRVSGRPDFYFDREQLAVFVDGCFWHGCPLCGHFPKTNSAFWRAKIERNQERDREKTAKLEQEGIRVARLWEHELTDNLRGCVDEIRQRLRSLKQT